MLVRCTKLFLELLAGIIVLIAVFAGVALWRLSSGPVQVDFLTPYIEESFANISRGYSISIDEMVVAWPSYEKSLELQAKNWRVLDPGGRLLATAPLVNVNLSLPALVQGVVAPTQIGIYGAELVITRGADGHVGFQRRRARADGAPMALGSETGLEVVLPGAAKAARKDRPSSDVVEQQGLDPNAEPLAAPTVAPTAEADSETRSGAKSETESATPGTTATPDGLVFEGDQSYSNFVRQMLDQVKAAPNLANPASYLHTLSFQGALQFVDKRMDIVWEAPDAELFVRRQGEDLAADVRLQLDMAGITTSANFGLLYNEQSGIIDVALAVENFTPTVLADLDDQLAALRGFQVPMDGRVAFQIDDAAGHLSDVSFDLAGEKGRINLPELFEQPLGVESLTLKGYFSDKDSLLVLEQAQAFFPSQAPHQPELTLSGQVAFLTDATEISLDAKLRDLPADELPIYWPKNAARGGRNWVSSSISAGVADEAWASLALSVPRGPAPAAALDVTSFDGGVSYSGLQVAYLKPMPPVAGVRGSGTFGLDQLTFTTQEGQVEGLRLPRAEVRILDLAGDPTLDLTFEAEGGFKDALVLLNHPRVALVDRLGIDPLAASGQAKMTTRMAFPLIKDLSFNDLAVTSRGNLSQAGLKRAVLNADITDGAFTLEVDTNRLQLSGAAKLGGVPLTTAWTETFAADAAVRTQLSAQVPAIDDTQLTALGILPTGDFLTGPISSAVEITLDPKGNGVIRTASNLTSAKMAQSTIGWEKPAGAPGKAFVDLELRDNALVGIPRLDLRAGSLQVNGTARFTDDEILKAQYDLDEVFVGKSSLRGLRVKQLANGGLEVDVAAGVLDIEPWLDFSDQPTPDAPEQPAVVRQSGSKVPLLLRAERLSQVYLGKGRFLSDVALDLRRSASGWERIGIKGRVPPEWSTHRNSTAETAAKSFSLDYKPASDGGYSLLVEAEDMGAVARAFNWVDTIEGGRLTLRGKMPGRLPDSPITGSVEAVDYRLVEAPGLAKMLSVASLTGISNVLNGEGLTFDRMTGDFTFDKGVISTPLFRAHGDSLGITSKGTIDTKADAVDLVGTVVPAYSFNAVLGQLPLLGIVLTGGEGEGLLAFTYRLSGPAEDPQIKVNPLSVLAPGFLRNLLGTPSKDDETEGPRALPDQPNNR